VPAAFRKDIDRGAGVYYSVYGGVALQIQMMVSRGVQPLISNSRFFAPPPGGQDGRPLPPSMAAQRACSRRVGLERLKR
jgi:hypothetical protein